MICVCFQCVGHTWTQTNLPSDIVSLWHRSLGHMRPRPISYLRCVVHVLLRRLSRTYPSLPFLTNRHLHLPVGSCGVALQVLFPDKERTEKRARPVSCCLTRTLSSASAAFAIRHNTQCLPHNPLQCPTALPAVPCSKLQCAVPCRAMQCHAVHYCTTALLPYCHAVPCSAMQCTTTPLPCSAVQCHAVPCCTAVPCSAMPCPTALRCHAVPYCPTAMQCTVVPCHALQCPAVPSSAMQCHALSRVSHPARSEHSAAPRISMVPRSALPQTTARCSSNPYRSSQSTPEHPAAPGNTLQHSGVPGYTLQHPAPHSHSAAPCGTLLHPAAHCSTLQHTAANGRTVLCPADHTCSAPYCAPLCSTFHHHAAHCHILACGNMQHNAHPAASWSGLQSPAAWPVACGDDC